MKKALWGEAQREDFKMINHEHIENPHKREGYQFM